jgi:TRL-like protein family
MNSFAKVVVSAVVLAVGVGCGILPYPTGSVYNGTTVPHGVDRDNLDGPGKAGGKDGEACATGILGLAAWGDASVDAAKKAGGISEVSSVELRNFSILGAVYSVGCTVVHGK